MNGNNLKNWIGFGASALLAACGGGGSEPTNTTSNIDPLLLINTPTLTSEAAAQISETTFRDLANIAVSANVTPFGNTDISSYNVTAALKSSSNVAPALDFATRAATTTSANCHSGSGSIIVADADADPTTTTAGDSRSGVYNNCFLIAGLFPLYIDGTFTHAINTVTGNVPSVSSLTELTEATLPFSITATTTTDIELQSMFERGFVLRDATITNINSSFDGNTLTYGFVSTGDYSLGDAETILVFRNQSANASVTRLESSSIDVTVSYRVTLLSNVFNGSVAVETLVPVHAIDNIINSGSVRVTGAGNSSLTVTIIADDTAQVEADFNGDGVVDRTETLVLDR